MEAGRRTFQLVQSLHEFAAFVIGSFRFERGLDDIDERRFGTPEPFDERRALVAHFRAFFGFHVQKGGSSGLEIDDFTHGEVSFLIVQRSNFGATL
ncbi:hypothetical protein [Rhodoblastus sp.]|uniref:hypothetical protein n=1 Tax=Rhodoblastus sp. TaxID=1962975 RepID=UPI0026241E88|nr:hypothetical protein [Rhodoblastus sp.]